VQKWKSGDARFAAVSYLCMITFVRSAEKKYSSLRKNNRRENKNMDRITEWLLEGPPWVQYQTRLELLDQDENEPEVQNARQSMLEHSQVKGLLADLSAWPGSVLTSHKSAGHLLHKLTFAADLGLKDSDPGIDQICNRILEHSAPTGPFQVLMNIPQHFGGTGENQWAWALCDAPLILYALAKFGLRDDLRVRAAVDHLANLARGNGWPCAVSPELGKFRGPGRKDDPCSFATLVMLKTLVQIPPWEDCQASRLGAEALLRLWDERQERHPYMFFMGTDFCKLKAPLVWYDILHVVDVLTQCPWLRGDARLQDMLQTVTSKADHDGVFTPQSVWSAWQDWDFGQKKAPSRWLTLLVYKAMRRMNR
jgi:hypothetical protein